MGVGLVRVRTRARVDNVVVIDASVSLQCIRVRIS